MLSLVIWRSIFSNLIRLQILILLALIFYILKGIEYFFFQLSDRHDSRCRRKIQQGSLRIASLLTRLSARKQGTSISAVAESWGQAIIFLSNLYRLFDII